MRKVQLLKVLGGRRFCEKPRVKKLFFNRGNDQSQPSSAQFGSYIEYPTESSRVQSDEMLFEDEDEDIDESSSELKDLLEIPHIKEDKEWPYLYEGDMFAEYFNVDFTDISEEDQKKVLKEALRRMNYTSINDIVLPTIPIEIPKDHSYYDILSKMKLSFENNGRMKMEDKIEIFQGIIDEVDHAMSDNTPLIQGMDEEVEDN